MGKTTTIPPRDAGRAERYEGYLSDDPITVNPDGSLKLQSEPECHENFFPTSFKRFHPTHGKLIYLACPYNHESGAVRHARYTYATRAAARLTLAGWMVFSPITHSNPINAEMGAHLGRFGSAPTGFESFETWREYDFAMLSRCDRVMVLRLKGWQESVGVTAEIAKAKELGMPVEYMDWTEDLGQETGVVKV